MAQDIVVDASVFAKAAELLARPLSPTALEKEQQEHAAGKSRPSPVTKIPSSQVAAKRSSPNRRPAARSPQLATARVEGPSGVPATGSAATSPRGAASTEQPAEAEEARLEAAGSGGGSILNAVAELNSLQKGWKEKINSPSFRKAPVPKVNRKPEPKVLTEEERHEKLGEIDALEQQLEEAKGKAAAVTAAASAAAAAAQAAAAVMASAPVGRTSDDEPDEHGEGAASHSSSRRDETEEEAYRRQAEERVRARRRQETSERRERDRREAEERQARQAEAESKARELEKAAKERVDARLREERVREQQGREECELQRQLKEQRAAGAEELRLQAAKRVAEREQAERRRALELCEAEAEERRLQAAESEAKVAEGRERTRLRMQRRAQDLREQQLQVEEAERRRLEAEASAAELRQQQAQLSQQKARARAAEFRERARADEEDRAFLEAEALAREQEQREAAARDRKQKRNWRKPQPAHPAPEQQHERCTSPPATGSRAPSPVSALCSAAPAAPIASSGRGPRAVSEPFVDHATAAPAPMSKGPNEQRSRPQHGGTSAPAAARANRAPKANDKPARRQGRAVSTGATSGSRAGGGAPAGSDDVAPGYGQAARRRSCSASAAVVSNAEDGTVRCTVGFFGFGESPLDDDGPEEFQADAVTEATPAPAMLKRPPVQPRPQARLEAPLQTQLDPPQASVRQWQPPAAPAARPASREAAQPVSQAQPVMRAMPVRAYSQPPPARPPMAPGSRASSPALSVDEPPAFNEDDEGIDQVQPQCLSPGAASNQSEQNSRQPRARGAQPWKQKAIKVAPTNYYLELLKAARGKGKPAPASGASPGYSAARGGDESSAGGAALAWEDGQRGYADQLRRRADDVQATQRREEGARYERGYAVLQRVQQRGLQARSHSTDSAPG